jgi:hypothetical protein
MATIPFSSNYQDLSSNRGFQFKFHCDKCGNGYMSTFKTSKFGMAASAEQLQSLVGGPLHDSALKDAVEEIRVLFKQCTRCGQWVCEPVCWNKKAQLCESCAPDLDEELAVAQAQAAKEQAVEKVKTVDWLADRNVAQAASVTCAKCGAKMQGGKFCPECGKPYGA